MAVTADALGIQVNIVQNANGKVAIIPHVPVISSSSRETATLLYMYKPNYNKLDHHYDAVVDMTPEDIIL